MNDTNHIKQAYSELTNQIAPFHPTLVAVSKRQSLEKIRALYHLGHRQFGENQVQEFLDKVGELPDDIQWHIIGHLQTNKVKYIVGKVALIHSLDRLKLAQKVNEISQSEGVTTSVLLQIKIADEDSKFGYDFERLKEELKKGLYEPLSHIKIRGVMGMATFTDDINQVRAEFKQLKKYFEELKALKFDQPDFSEISMGMSGDYEIALEEGATMIRVGSKLFGTRIAY